jgi:hypothetical protein
MPVQVSLLLFVFALRARVLFIRFVATSVFLAVGVVASQRKLVLHIASRFDICGGFPLHLHSGRGVCLPGDPLLALAARTVHMGLCGFDGHVQSRSAVGWSSGPVFPPWGGFQWTMFPRHVCRVRGSSSVGQPGSRHACIGCLLHNSAPCGDIFLKPLAHRVFVLGQLHTQLHALNPPPPQLFLHPLCLL